MAADIRAIIVIIGLRPETLVGLLGADVPGRLEIVVAGRAYQAHFKGTAVNMVYIGLEPSTLLGEIVRFKGSKIAAYLWIQTGLALQGCNDGLW